MVMASLHSHEGDMSRYNTKHIPIFAPCGFPSWARLGEMPSEDQIKRVQRLLNIGVDGKCGANTVEAIAEMDYGRRKGEDVGTLILGPHAAPVGVKTRTYLDEPELGKTRAHRRRHPLIQGVLHYDVTNDSYDAPPRTLTTLQVLLRRRLSIHFAIDWDGTIMQSHNPTTKQCIHAGRRCNRASFGLDLNNPALRKYERLHSGQTPRREVETEVHGRKMMMLDYHDAQIESLRALLAAVDKYLNIPSICPRDGSGEAITTVIKNPHKHHGIITHYQITRSKIDAAPLRWDEVCPRRTKKGKLNG
jgi:hypothetical protein